MHTKFNDKAFCEICNQFTHVLRFYNSVKPQLSKHFNEHVPESIVVCQRCREDGWQAYIDMKKHAKRKP